MVMGYKGSQVLHASPSPWQHTERLTLTSGVLQVSAWTCTAWDRGVQGPACSLLALSSGTWTPALQWKWLKEPGWHSKQRMEWT